jgi:hypothetical protein
VWTATDGCGNVGTCSHQVVVGTSAMKISQIYGAGGNLSAEYLSDYIELYNAGAVPQLLTGWSVQYMAATTTTAGNFSVTALPAGATVQPGQYFLVKEADGTTNPAGQSLALPVAGRHGHDRHERDRWPRAAGQRDHAPDQQLGCLDPGPDRHAGRRRRLRHDGRDARAARRRLDRQQRGALRRVRVTFRLGGGNQDTNNNNADFARATRPAQHGDGLQQGHHAGRSRLAVLR